MLYGKYRFRSRFKSDAVLPYYKGSTFRGVFGHALKKVVCALKQQVCSECLLKDRCVYALVFESAETIRLPTGSRIAHPPHPFVIEPLLTTETFFENGSDFDFALLLFGEVNHSLPYFIYAFDRMGKIGIGKRINNQRGQFALKTVTAGNQSIYTEHDQALHDYDSKEMT